MIAFLAFVVQLVVAVFAFIGRDSIAGTLMLGFATDSLGIFFIVSSVFAALPLAAALAKRALAAVLVVAALRFLISGIAALSSNDEITKTAAALGFLFAGASLYTAFALVLEDARGAQAFPVGRSPSNTGDVARPGTAPQPPASTNGDS